MKLNRDKWESDNDIELDIAFENTSSTDYPTKQDFLDHKWQEFKESMEEQEILNKGY